MENSSHIGNFRFKAFVIMLLSIFHIEGEVFVLRLVCINTIERLIVLYQTFLYQSILNGKWFGCFVYKFSLHGGLDNPTDKLP